MNKNGKPLLADPRWRHVADTPADEHHVHQSYLLVDEDGEVHTHTTQWVNLRARTDRPAK